MFRKTIASSNQQIIRNTRTQIIHSAGLGGYRKLIVINHIMKEMHRDTMIFYSLRYTKCSI